RSCAALSAVSMSVSSRQAGSTPKAWPSRSKSCREWASRSSTALMTCVAQHEPLLNATLAHGFFHLRRDVHERHLGGNVEREVLGARSQGNPLPDAPPAYQKPQKPARRRPPPRWLLALTKPPRRLG